MAYADEIYRGLPRPRLDLQSMLYDTPPPGRRYNKSFPVNTDGDTYQLMQDLIANRNLPFAGSLSMFVRHCIGAGIESLNEYLDSGGRTLLRALRDQQRRITAERYALTIENQLDDITENLGQWTADREWGAVVYSLEESLANLDDYPIEEWKTRAARGWLQHQGVKSLLRIWETELKGDDMEKWMRVVRVMDRFGEMSRQ